MTLSLGPTRFLRAHSHAALLSGLLSTAISIFFETPSSRFAKPVGRMSWAVMVGKEEGRKTGPWSEGGGASAAWARGTGGSMMGGVRGPGSCFLGSEGPLWSFLPR